MTTTTMTATRTITATLAPAATFLVRKLEASGLTVTVGGSYRGGTEILVNGHGRDSVFGVIVVGRTSGRVLRAHLRFGNDGDEITRHGLAEVRELVSRVRPYMATVNAR